MIKKSNCISGYGLLIKKAHGVLMMTSIEML